MKNPINDPRELKMHLNRKEGGLWGPLRNQRMLEFEVASAKMIILK